MLFPMQTSTLRCVRFEHCQACPQVIVLLLQRGDLGGVLGRSVVSIESSDTR